MADAADEFVNEYLRELEYLRREGRDFAADHPKVAGRLRLQDNESQDPHVERLLEGFAFLTARIQRKLDDDHAELASSLLGVLDPHLVRPVPSMCLAEVALDTEQSVPAAGKVIPRGTTFSSPPVRGEPLKFRSTADVTLHPIRVSELRVEAPDARAWGQGSGVRSLLHVGLTAAGEHPFGVMGIDDLRFTLKGTDRIVYDLYESLTTSVVEVVIASGGRELLRLPAGSLVPCGFDEAEASLPYPRRSFAGYRLLQEYFAFPDKFHAFRLTGLDALAGLKARDLEVRILLSREFEVEVAEIGPGNLSLGAVPLVNLFAMTADPVLVTPYQSEYDVVPDAHRARDLEVWSVEGVTGISARTGERVAYEPFYSLRHGRQVDGPQAFWHDRRRPSQRVGDNGTEVSLALVQLDMTRAELEEQTLHLELLCTNRDTPANVSQWGGARDFQIEGVTGIKSVSCLERPTRALRLDAGSSHWRLVSGLALNYLSLVGDGGENLREMMRTYDLADTPATRQQIDGVQDVVAESVVRRVRAQRGAGFCRGMRATLTLDRSHFVGASPVLFAAVIDRFLALSCAVNSFSQLALQTPQDQGLVHEWPPRTGEQIVL